MGESPPQEGESSVVVSLSDAAMHMYTAAIDALSTRVDPSVIAPTCDALRIVKRELDAKTTLLGLLGGAVGPGPGGGWGAGC